MTTEHSFCDLLSSVRPSRIAAPVLWRVFASGWVRTPPNQPYWYDNRQRNPRGGVVIQISHAGRIVLRKDDSQTDVQPGQCLMFAYGENSSYGICESAHDGYENQWISLQGQGLLAHYESLCLQLGNVFHPASDLTDRMQTLADLAAPQANTPPHTMAIACYRFMVELFDHAQQRLDQTRTPAQRAVEQVLRRPLQPLTVDQIAHRHGCSREHFTRLFRQQVGMSPARYMAQARLKRAIDLLTQTDLPTTAVAQQAGFVSLMTLSRQVRRATGKTPAKLRRSSRRIGVSG